MHFSTHRISVSLLLLSAAATWFSGCEEEPPAIDFSVPPKDTTYMSVVTPATQLRNVLLEDFTGVQCPNCPDAQTVAKNLQDANPGRIVVVGIHPAPPLMENLCRPLNEPPDHVSKYDFRTEDGKNIANLIGTLQGLPSGAINRTISSGNDRFYLPASTWSGSVNNQLAAGSPCKIEFIKKEYDSTRHKLTVRVKVTYYGTEPDSNYLSVGLTESHIVDIQETKNTAFILDYEHNHVLRKMITSYQGGLLNASRVAGRVFEREFTTKLSSDWIPENMHIYAYVHKDAVKLDVIQVEETELLP